jgi:electron transfer flavoprotein beta subunit
MVQGGQPIEIYVLVKQVPDPEAIVRVKSDSELKIENKYFTNFFDEIAIEAGLKMREKSGGDEWCPKRAKGS